MNTKDDLVARSGEAPTVSYSGPTLSEPVVLPVDLRDYFAAKAMAAVVHLDHAELRDFTGEYEPIPTVNLVAVAAYQVADQMLKARQS